MNEKVIYYGKQSTQAFTKADLDRLFSVYDIKRLEAYCKNIIDYHVILDLVPKIARLFFNGSVSEHLSLSPVQCCILVGLGLQYKHVEAVADELNLKVNQILSIFNKTIRRLLKFFMDLEEDAENKSLPESIPNNELRPLQTSLNTDLQPKASNPNTPTKETSLLDGIASPQFIIQGDDKAWEEAALQMKGNKVPHIISVKRKASAEVKNPKHFVPKKKQARNSAKK